MARLKKTRVKLLLVFAAALLVLLGCGTLLLPRFRGGASSDGFAVLYSKGGQQLYLQTGRDTVALRAKESKQQIFAGDGNILFYDAVTDEGLTLYVCNLDNKNSRREGGTLIAAAVEPLWAADAEGRYAVYRQGKRLFRYDRAAGGSLELSAGIETLYAAPGLSAVFFTKLEGQRRMLYRCAMGAQPERVASAVLEAHFYADGADALLFLLEQATEDTVVLAALGPDGGVKEIARNPAEVFFEDCVPGGNLYYLEKGEEIPGVSVVLEDPLQASDAALQKPKRDDYWHIGILTSYFGEKAYEQAMREYNAKAERDSLREEVRRILQEKPSGLLARQDCWVYDGTQARLLAEGLAAEDIILLRARGRPALIYDKFHVEAQEGTRTVTLAELLSLRQGGGEKGEKAVAKRLAELTRQTAEHAGVYLARTAASGVSEIELTRELSETRMYDFPPGPAGTELLLCREKDVVDEKASLYAYDLTEYGLSERRLVDSSVTELLFPPDDADPFADPYWFYYRKQESGSKRSNLFGYDGALAKKLVPDIDGAFFAEGRGPLLAVSGVKEQLCTLWVCAGAEAWKAAEGVRTGSARTSGTRVYYIAEPAGGSGSLYTREEGKEPVLLDTEVTEIIAVRQ